MMAPPRARRALSLVALVSFAISSALAQTIPNSSFETNTFAIGDGFVSANTPITGWTANPTNMVGLNPAGNGNVFADNGAVPSGTKVAFLKSTGGATTTLSTTITGLTVGKTYRVQFRANRRVTGGTVAPEPSYRLNGGAAVPFYMGLGVGGSNPYYTINGVFTATATTAALEVSNTTTGDSYLLVDNFLVTAATAIQVTNTSDNVVPPAGSLRKALADAQNSAVPNVITFSAALNGGTINLTSQITINDPNGVCIDASALSNSIKIVPAAGVRPFFNAIGSVCAMRKVRIENANVSSHAGAILNEGVLDLAQCWFSGNVASGVGAAVFNSNVISVTDCLFVGNTSAIAAAALLHQGSSATVTRCTLMNNHADAIGGALYATAPGLSITACTFTGNSSNDAGGAIYLDQLAVLKLTHCTISDNTGAYGGGISNHGTMTAKNCIIAENTATVNGSTGDVENNGFASGKGVFTREGANIIQDFANTSGGTDSGPPEIDDDPDLAGILESGGFTPTMAIDKDSPARNAAVDSTATTDQRGRPIIGMQDIGAYEMQAGVFSLTATTYKTLEGTMAHVIIDRGGQVSGDVTVRLTTTNGTAKSGTDYEARTNTATYNVDFTDGDATADPGVVTLPDFLAEPNETLTVTLSMPAATTGATLGTPLTASVTIQDPLQVTNTNDDGTGSLRQAIAAAAANPGPDAVNFATALNGQTITLGSDLVSNDPDGVTVDASNLAAGITIDGGPGDNRILTVDTGSVLTLRRVNLTGGDANGQFGGAIYNTGTVTLDRCTLSGNTTPQSGGAIYSDFTGALTLTKCTLSGNTAMGDGGAICVAPNGSATLQHCTISGNSAVNHGGGIFNDDNGEVSLSYCTLSVNNADTMAGGIYNDSSASATLDRCIVFGNSCGVTPATGDMYNTATGLLTLVGKSFVGSFTDDEGTPDGTGTLDNANPKLLPLAANGGPTRTHALDSDSPARDAGVSLLGYTDQRGFSSVGPTDIGAYELQPGGVFSLTQTSYTANEGSPVSVTVKRSSGAGAASVRVITTAGTATSPADFTARPNTAASVLNFADGQTEATITPPGIPTVNTAGTEPNEVFTISLTNPSAGATLGTPSSAPAVIVDPSSPGADGSFPSTTFTFPAANQILNVPVGGTIVVTGTATDNRGIFAVSYDDGGTNSGIATLLAPNAASTGWTFTITPVAGLNEMYAAVGDTQLNITPAFNPPRTFMVHRPLLVNVSGNGSVTSGFSPSSYREVGRLFTVTATPGAGSMFAGWTILSNHTTSDIGVGSIALEKPTLPFTFREGLALRANFVPNPYPEFAAASGTEYIGLIHADFVEPLPDGTPPNNSTEGLLTVTLMSNGSFSGKIALDGTTLPVNGAFDHAGVARFGTTRVTTAIVTRAGKPSLLVEATIDLDPGRISDTIIATITAKDFQQSVTTAVSMAIAHRAYYDGLTPATTLDSNYLGANDATQNYTVIMPSVDNTGPDYEERDYPQGTGFALLNVSKAGVVKITTGKAADGSPLTLSTKLSKNNTFPIFIPLYGNKGWLSGDVLLDYASSESDMGGGLRWFRPIDTTKHHYPAGWQVPIDVLFLGARYSTTFVPPGSVLLRADDAAGGDPDDIGDPLLPPDPVLGNATLAFYFGQLTEDIIKEVNVSPTNVVSKVVTNDPTYSLTLSPSTGAFSGKFVHEFDAGVPTPLQTDFQGVLYQKCDESGGHGFFLMRPTIPIDYTGESGNVMLIGN